LLLFLPDKLKTAANEIAKYDELASTHIFYSVAIETGGTWNHWADELVQEIGRRTTIITGEPRESTFLFQQLSSTPLPLPSI